MTNHRRISSKTRVTHLVRAFVTPREDVRARISVESLGKPAHHALLDELAFLDRHGGEGAVEQAGGVCVSPRKTSRTKPQIGIRWKGRLIEGRPKYVRFVI